VPLTGADFCLWLKTAVAALPIDFRNTLNNRHAGDDVGLQRFYAGYSRSFRRAVDGGARTVFDPFEKSSTDRNVVET